MKQGQIDELYNRVTEAEAITQQVINKMTKQTARIEALEAALRELADLMDDVVSGGYTPDSFTTQPARAALAPEQDK